MATITTADIRAYVADRQTEGLREQHHQPGARGTQAHVSPSPFRRGSCCSGRTSRCWPSDNARKGFFERAQFDAVRNRCRRTYQALVTLAYYTGWRINSEILTLEWRQIDRKAGVIRLEPGTTKNREGRMFKYGELARGEGRDGGPVGAPRGAASAGHPHAAGVLPSKGQRIGRSGSAGGRRARPPAVPAGSRTTSAARRCGI